ncbi:hypothetical protein ACH5RR_021820 [Cinchona calisaya]|uniref:Uncharacterized protein n=1 Tax=Cinchona calisaya TaxID=153742 RepID=A0ABD2ZIC6_9GENT
MFFDTVLKETLRLFEFILKCLALGENTHLANISHGTTLIVQFPSYGCVRFQFTIKFASYLDCFAESKEIKVPRVRRATLSNFIYRCLASPSNVFHGMAKLQ